MPAATTDVANDAATLSKSPRGRVLRCIGANLNGKLRFDSINFQTASENFDFAKTVQFRNMGIILRP